ncbi:MAG: IS1595 family transposase [Planctomycetes bacterium]|nr:IS1595 family transposase [Planctomycetota bacterium]
MNLIEVASLTEDDAMAYLESLRWPDGPVCPHCGSSNCTRMNGKAHRKGCIQCNNSECRKQFTVKVGSILESSKVSLVKWVLAFHLLCSSKKGFSALQLKRELSLGSYRTAWFMLHRIRHAMETQSFDKPMEGVVEVDETYIGGKPRYKQKGRTGRGTTKQPVMALVQRQGEVRCGPIPNVTSKTLIGAIRKHVQPDAVIVTDELPAYKRLTNYFAEHEHVKHSRRQYVKTREDGFKVFSNTVESFFALIKRGHYGVYHSMSKAHIHRYCAEYGFRWNHRMVSDSSRRDAAIRRISGKRLKYKTSS